MTGLASFGLRPTLVFLPALQPLLDGAPDRYKSEPLREGHLDCRHLVAPGAIGGDATVFIMGEEVARYNGAYKVSKLHSKLH